MQYDLKLKCVGDKDGEAGSDDSEEREVEIQTAR